MSSFVSLHFKRDGKGKICCRLYSWQNEVLCSPLVQSRERVLPLGGSENGLPMLNDLESPIGRCYKSF